jgi:hypothetical protein
MIRKTVYAFGLLFACSTLSLAETGPSSWKKGLVVSADVNGYGLNPGNRKDYRGASDIWWSYRITAECFSYSVVSRRTPSQSGLRPNTQIRFWEQKSRIYILDRNGKPLALKIVRKDKSKKCR